jgi:transcriptional regulator with XRE-family HTH domain
MLKELRTDKKLSQAQVAGAMGAPQSFVSKYETGERRLDFAEVLALLSVLQADPQVFLARYLGAITRSGSTAGPAKPAGRNTKRVSKRMP